MITTKSLTVATIDRLYASGWIDQNVWWDSRYNDHCVVGRNAREIVLRVLSENPAIVDSLRSQGMVR